MKRPDGVHHTGRIFRVYFSHFYASKTRSLFRRALQNTSKNLSVSCWNSNLRQGGRERGREDQSGAVPVSPQLPGRGSNQSPLG